MRRVDMHPRWRQLASDIGGVVAMSMLVGAALTIMMAASQPVNALLFAILSLISLCFAGTYQLVFRAAFGPLLIRSRSAATRWMINLLAVLVVAGAGGGLAIGLVALLGGRVQPLRVAGIGLAVVTAIRLTELGYERLRHHVRVVELREEVARRQAVDAQLAALQARVDPHFLFNSLNTVAGLIEEDPRRAVEVVTRLAAYFRHSLRSGRNGETTLDDELQAATTYLEIQALRFGDRLDWSVDAPPGALGARVPSFLLQPLVENAVLHGASEGRKRTRIRLTVATEDDRLRITIEDDGPGPGRSRHRGSGTSLADLAHRLELLHGRRAALETGPGPGGGFRSVVTVPSRTEEER